MIELSLRSFLSEFNGSKFVVFFFLLIFSFLCALKLDETLDVSWIIIFGPIWFGEFVVLMGFFVGVVAFCSQPPSRYDNASRVDFVCMCLTTLEHLFLIAFEVLCVYKLEFAQDDKEFTWSLVCLPLFIESIVAMITAVWSVRNDKTFEFEMFFAINVVQFVFIAFKLDDTLRWNWVVVFVPTWVLFSLGVIGTLYSLLLSVFLTRSLHALQQHRRAQVYVSACHLILAVPLITFFVLLTARLDAFKGMTALPPLPAQVITTPPPILQNIPTVPGIPTVLSVPSGQLASGTQFGTGAFGSTGAVSGSNRLGIDGLDTNRLDGTNMKSSGQIGTNGVLGSNLGNSGEKIGNYGTTGNSGTLGSGSAKNSETIGTDGHLHSTGSMSGQMKSMNGHINSMNDPLNTMNGQISSSRSHSTNMIVSPGHLASMPSTLAIQAEQLSFLVLSVPLYSALFLLILMTFGSPSGNSWWFGMRTPFCNFIFDAFPFLRQYANISYRIGVSDQQVQRPNEENSIGYSGPPRTLSTIRMTTHLWSIETPD
ncbi:unnamed protein product [Bursaphelenchus okinawaensis]|uniref:Uncharacterized protein n=1 Tax=Bursaphelenchus okinawaensis TaxID=465554 RepID=A0A811KTT9_9BILA|nr:unnamed protein product [Bursaphelenchus okinawaensis]CAG9109851.1 unnamed protein product [Bursaphelenchus okinawaensis]